MNRLIKEISSQNLDVFCILAMRLHETPNASNSYGLLKSFIQSNVPWTSVKAVNKHNFTLNHNKRKMSLP